MTCTAAVPATPESVEAEIVADPRVVPAVTAPFTVTDAMAGLLDVHASGAPRITAPAASSTDALSVRDAPAKRVLVAGVTTTRAAFAPGPTKVSPTGVAGGFGPGTATTSCTPSNIVVVPLRSS